MNLYQTMVVSDTIRFQTEIFEYVHLLVPKERKTFLNVTSIIEMCFSKDNVSERKTENVPK